MSDEHICCICQRRPYERRQVCDPCRGRLSHTIAIVAHLWAQLVHPVPDPLEEWTVRQLRRLPVPTTNPARYPAWVPGPWITEQGYDPIAAAIPAQAKPTDSSPRVSGSREAPVPVNLDAIDLTLPPGPGVIHDPNHDQIGQISVAAIMDQWARDWDEMRYGRADR
jgi:hypothetical protein